MLLDTVRKTIKSHRLLDKHDAVLIGVSGGPDSLALLHVLLGLKKEWGLTIYVAHLDHMLRGDSKADSKFVMRQCRALGIPFIFKQVNMKKSAREGSIEEACRNARLEFLCQAAQNIRADKIALGHNLDDQAETVLMRLLRGSGLYGLAGILPKKEILGHTFIRPLLGVRRREIETFLKRKKLVPRRDRTNQQDKFFRNKIRIRLLPLLEKKYNANIKGLLSNTAETIAADYDYLFRAAEAAAKTMGRTINLKKFLTLHPAIQRLVLRLYISRIQGNTRRIGFQHIREIEDMIKNRPAGSRVDLPQGVSAKKSPRTIEIFRRTN